jgi:hypothetical protein
MLGISWRSGGRLRENQMQSIPSLLGKQQENKRLYVIIEVSMQAVGRGCKNRITLWEIQERLRRGDVCIDLKRM